MNEAEINKLTEAVIGSAIEVHRLCGTGLLENAYRQFMCRELDLRGIPFETERVLPIEYKGVKVNTGYRLDLLVAKTVVVELKAIDTILPVHKAQLRTYMRLGGCRSACSSTAT